MMLGLPQRYWTLEGMKSLAMVVVIMCVCGGSIREEGCRGMSDLAQSEKNDIPSWERSYQQHPIICGFPSVHQQILQTHHS